MPLKARIAGFAMLSLLLMGWLHASPAFASGDGKSNLCAPSTNTGEIGIRRTILAGVPAIVRVPAHVSRPSLSK
ncbi:MAG TPA: hypothetical protein VFG49_11230 [Dyella sp.]|uniref:hypothetical protein n=1 Tax=Dyella sp. TaxID=1869338 RepID=UPI002D77A2C1|nr:hypothetical protein [Dyella sp.]HET6554098.1 hypothetical protein [Dyella sp.]